MIPHLANAIQIYAVIPATSCSAERSFSSLRRLKTYLRNTMGQNRLSSLALLHIEREYINRVLSEDMDRIIDAFGNRPGRNTFFFWVRFVHLFNLKWFRKYKVVGVQLTLFHLGGWMQHGNKWYIFSKEAGIWCVWIHQSVTLIKASIHPNGSKLIA